MNLPNKLTTFRMILIPFFVLFLLTGFLPTSVRYLLALLLFVAASLTDMLDGRISRKQNLVTNFGKLMDPLADKLLVCSALICLLSIGMVPAWAVIVIIAREFVISGFRLIAAEHQIVIAAGMWGKVKTVFQMVSIILFLFSSVLLPHVSTDLSSSLTAMAWIAMILYILAVFTFYVAVVLTVVSLIEYLVKNRAILKEQD